MIGMMKIAGKSGFGKVIEQGVRNFKHNPSMTLKRDEDGYQVLDGKRLSPEEVKVMRRRNTTGTVAGLFLAPTVLGFGKKEPSLGDNLGNLGIVAASGGTGNYIGDRMGIRKVRKMRSKKQ